MIAIYPGSFNPWHDGHTDILIKARQVFNKVIVAIGRNPEKYRTTSNFLENKLKIENIVTNIEVVQFDGLLIDFLKEIKVNAIIRGLRNAQDFEFEKSQQYWNEDLGLNIPIFYIISDRELTHFSSSAIRSIEAFKSIIKE